VRVLYFAFSLVLGPALVGAPLLVAGPASGQSSDIDLNDFPRRIEELAQAGRYAEAVSLAERYVARTRRRYGEKDIEFATAIAWLGFVYKAQGRYAEAEPLYKRALAIREKVLGLDHLDVVGSLNHLAGLYYTQGRYAEAEPLYKRDLAITENALGSEHLDVAISLNELAWVHYRQDRYGEAEPLFKRALAIREKLLGPDHIDVATSLSNLANVYYSWQARGVDAEPLYKRALAIREAALGPEDILTATSLQDLADTYYKQRRYADAEPLYRRTLTIREAALGPEDILTARSIQDLADSLVHQSRHAEAEPLSRRALAIREKLLGSDHRNTAYTLNQLSWSIQEQGRNGEAELLLRRALAIRVKVLGSEHSSTAYSLQHLAVNLARQNRFAEAQPLAERALAIHEKLLGPDHLDVARGLMIIATLHVWQNRLSESEPLLKRALAMREKALSRDHADVAEALRYLANSLNWQGRYAEAESLYKRALATSEKALGPDHPTVGQILYDFARFIGSDDLQTTRALYERALLVFEKHFGPEDQWVGFCLAGLAYVHYVNSRYGDAEPLSKRALRIVESAYGVDHPFVADRLNGLANIYFRQGRYADAEPLYRRALVINEKAVGADHFLVAGSLGHLADIRYWQGRYADAEPLYRRALGIYEKSFGFDHQYVGDVLRDLADVYFRQADWINAATYYERTIDIAIRRTRLGANAEAPALTTTVKSDVERANSQFRSLIKATYRLPGWEANPPPELAASMFRTAQWAQTSDAATSLAQMAARYAKGETTLARLVRERQDLVGEWQMREKGLLSARLLPSDGRNTTAESALSKRITGLEARIGEIDRLLAKDFPDFAALTNPEPLAITEVQTLLRADEALILFLDMPEWKPTPEETFIWVVTRRDARWFRIELGTQALGKRMVALRCGLDLWYGEGAQACRDLLKLPPSLEFVTAGASPFDLTRAYEMYQALLGPAEDLIKGKQLLVVPSGPLTFLPFHVLVTEAPTTAIPVNLADYRDASWLGIHQPITILPSVSSLKALREFAKTSHATKSYLGIGNPLLVGRQDDSRWGAYYRKQAQAARDKQHCSKASAPSEQIVMARGRRSAPSFHTVFRGAQADIERVRAWSPLPETADELCEVGRRLGVPESDILLGNRATEGRLKDLSEAGQLADYKIVHFATHGALTGQVQGSAEPGLILTPPARGTDDPKLLERDDGYLTTSEIATLKLDADFVILSACSTAAGRETNERLSGIARAFFYAGARALLVSHWEVASHAAVKLTTRAFAQLQSNPRMGRAEAFRLSMREFIENGTSAEAHPSVWAPFVVVGEGAVGQ
jgi:CHAT domain-containing protein/tetratricopeptide (TPR) repeat protein